MFGIMGGKGSGQKADIIPQTEGARLLLKYLERFGMTQAEFCEVQQLSKSYINRCLNGIITPNLQTAIQIEDSTAGETPVLARSWLEPPREDGDG